ncbi:hypothetical protein MASR1M45_15640 [Candidatus Kapaibacterium sp.]
MDFEKFTREQLIKQIQDLKDENAYLRHITSEMDVMGFQLNSMLYQVMLNNFPFMAWMKDTLGKFTAVNHLFEKTYNISSVDVLGKTDYNLVSKDLADEFTNEDEIVIKSGKAQNIIAHRVIDNNHKWFETYKTPIFDKNGKVIALLGMTRDVTEQFILKTELEKSEYQLRTLTDSIPVGIYRTDAHGNFIFINSTLANILGFNSKQDLLETNAGIYYYDKSDRENLISQLKKNNFHQQILKLKTIDGKEKWVKDVSKVVKNDDECVEENFLIDGILDDITDVITKENQLNNQISLYNDSFVNLPLATVIIDDSYNLIFASNEFYKLFGYSDQEILNKNLKNIIVPPNLSEESKFLLINTDLYDLSSIESQRLHKNGDLISVRIICKKFISGEVKKYYSIVYQNISENLDEMKDLKTSEARYKLLAENSFDGVYIITNKGYEYVNPKFCEITGYTESELLSPEFHFDVLLTDESREFMRKRFQARYANLEIPDNYSITINSKYGEIKELEVVTKNISRSNELRILGIMQDVTSRHASMRMLRESYQRFKLLFDNSPGVAYLCKNDERYTVFTINSKIFDIVGYTKEDFIEQKVFFTDFYFEDEHRMIFDTVDDALSSRKPWHLIYKLKHKNGGYRWCEEFGEGLFIEGELQYLGGIIFDITDRISMQNELQRLNNDLEERVILRTKELDQTLFELTKARDELEISLDKEKELSELKSKFISMVSHEYRTPLTVILTSTYLLERYYVNQETEPFNESLKRIQDSIKNITKILEDVLIIGKEDIGTKELKKSNINIKSFLNEIINEVKYNISVDRIIEVNVDDNLILFTDYTNLRYIALNLLTNAIKYSNDKSVVRISSYIEKSSVCINITDEGIGIPHNEINHLFEPFYRFSNVGNIPGIGLGMTIVKNAVDLLDGKINVISEIGKGTTFIVAFPQQ